MPPCGSARAWTVVELPLWEIPTTRLQVDSAIDSELTMPSLTVKVDAKGRLTIPRDLREALAIQPGDTLFVEREGDVLRYAKAGNPFDILADYAREEQRAGRTKRIRDFAAENSIALDAE
jgi:AbrB family looped-hinge helix DNA binding protein